MRRDESGVFAFATLPLLLLGLGDGVGSRDVKEL